MVFCFQGQRLKNTDDWLFRWFADFRNTRTSLPPRLFYYGAKRNPPYCRACGSFRRATTYG